MKAATIPYKEAYDKISSLGGCDATDEWSKGYDEGITAALNALEDIPQEEKHSGHWIEKADEYYKTMLGRGVPYEKLNYLIEGDQCACSACGGRFENMTEGIDDWRYCPLCGAEFEEAKVHEAN